MWVVWNLGALVGLGLFLSLLPQPKGRKRE